MAGVFLLHETSPSRTSNKSAPPRTVDTILHVTAPEPSHVTFDPASPVALYELHGERALAFCYKGEFWMEILHPGDAVSKHLNGFLITPSNSSGINQTPIYIAQDPLSEPSYLVRPIDLNAGYKVIPKEGFEETAHFIDGPETLLRSELSRVSEELKRVQLRMDHYRAGLESVAFHLRWGRRQPHFTVFGAVSSTTAVVEYVLDKPIERIEKKRPKK